MFLNIQNNGPELISTNYWDTLQGRTQFAYGANAGTMRLLVPTDREHEIPDMIRGCDYVIISTISNPAVGKPSIEFLFEDHSDTPYVLHACAGSAIGLFPAADPYPKERPFTLWVKGPRKVATLREFSRRVSKLPWLKPLNLG